MAERRKASSTVDDHWSTAKRKGMSPKGERIFNVASSIVILLFAIGWSWSIALARGSITTRPATQTTGILASALTGFYYIGNWPSGRVTPKADYTPPSGFIEVTPETQNTALSEHFKLRDFFPHDQQGVWPKYIVVKMKLIDKLELVLQDLNAHGIRTEGIRVLSGFRTPQ